MPGRAHREAWHRVVRAVGFVTPLAGCTFMAGEAEPPYRPSRLPETTLECIFIRSIEDWKAIDAYRLVIYAPGRRNAYLVELNSYCPDLRFADSIALDSGLDGQLCGFGGDAILVGNDRCTVGAIHPYEPGQPLEPAEEEPGAESSEDD